MLGVGLGFEPPKLGKYDFGCGFGIGPLAVILCCLGFLGFQSSRLKVRVRI